jgi:pilus assembly protein CpaD
MQGHWHISARQDFLLPNGERIKVRGRRPQTGRSTLGTRPLTFPWLRHGPLLSPLGRGHDPRAAKRAASTNKLRAALAAVAVAALSGCGSTGPEGIKYADFQAAPRQVIEVQKRSETHPLYVDQRTGQPSPLERERLKAFLDDLAGERPEALRLTIRGPGSAEQLQRIAPLLVVSGIERDKIRIEPGQPPGPQGPAGTQTVMIAAERAVAVAPECPGWVDHVSAPGDNRVLPNFGCSDVSNLARMVADPNDLVRGRSSLISDGERAASAVTNYREDKVKDLPRRRAFDVITPIR